MHVVISYFIHLIGICKWMPQDCKSIEVPNFSRIFLNLIIGSLNLVYIYFPYSKALRVGSGNIDF